MNSMSILSAVMLLGALGARLKPAEKGPKPDEVPAITAMMDDVSMTPTVNTVSNKEQDTATKDTATPTPEEKEEAAKQAATLTEALHFLHDSMLSATQTSAQRGMRRTDSVEKLTELYQAMEPDNQDDDEFAQFLDAEAELWRLVEEKEVLIAEADESKDKSEKVGLLRAAVAVEVEIGEHGRAIRIAMHYHNQHQNLLNDVQIEDMIKAAAGDDWEAEVIAQEEADKRKTEAEGEAMMDPESQVEEKIEDEIEDMIEADLRATGKNMVNAAAGEDLEFDDNAQDEANTNMMDDDEPDSREESMQFEHSNMIASEIAEMLDFDLGLDYNLMRSSTNDDFFGAIEQDISNEAKAKAKAEDREKIVVYHEKNAAKAAKLPELDEEDEWLAAAETAAAKAAEADVAHLSY